MGKLKSSELALLSIAVSNFILFGGQVLADITSNNEFQYVVDEEGNMEVTGELKLSALKKCYLVEKKDEEGNIGLCIINKDGVDILTDEYVTNVHEVEGVLLSLDDNIFSVKSMKDYLDGYEDDLFSSEEIREMILAISQTFEWHEYKTLSYIPKEEDA